METNETMTPEDVERDVDTVRTSLANGGYGNDSMAFDALTRLATAAARVPGLEAERRAILEEMATLESERDAARQEVERLQEQVDAWKEECGLVGSSGDPENVTPAHLAADLQKRDAEHARLTARVAELEARATERREHLLELQDAKSAAEARATAAEAKVKTLEERVRELHGDFIMNGPDAPTPAPGLRELANQMEQGVPPHWPPSRRRERERLDVE